MKIAKTHRRSIPKKSKRIPKKQNNKKLNIPYILSHRDLDTIKSNTLTVAYYPYFYPVSYNNSRGNAAGLDVDIIKLFAKQAKLDIVFKEYDSFNGIWNKPSLYKADVSIGGIANSKGRTKSTTEWSIPYFYVNRSLIFKKSNPIRNFPNDVNGPIVATYESTGWKDAEKLLKRVRKQRLLIKGNNDKDDLSDLLEGKIDGLIRGNFLSRVIISDNPSLGMIEWQADPSILASDGEVFAFPTKKGSGIAILLSTFLIEIIKDGTIVKLMKKHRLV